MKIKIQLDNNDVRELIYESFCNGGLQELAYSGVRIDWDYKKNNDNYANAKLKLKKEKPDIDLCYEDVLTEMFVSYGIYFRDYEEDDIERIRFTFNVAKKHLDKALDGENSERLVSKIQRILPEYDDADAYDYDYILQTAMYGRLIYG